MRQIPRTVTEDGAKTPGERAGQFREQISALFTELSEYIEDGHWIENQSARVRDLHEQFRNWIHADRYERAS